jgi:hypothetical protein
VERTHIYPTLAAALTKRGFDPASVEKFGQLWDSITPVDRLPCPLCFAYADKRSALKSLAVKSRKRAIPVRSVHRHVLFSASRVRR